ncbi:MAG: hypothetical protein ACI8VW_002581 [bacterium]|jgi:2,4-dienoyl-CoA reductase-like NADH-dependent reductase (Old Yellow Enzyme family)
MEKIIPGLYAKATLQAKNVGFSGVHNFLSFARLANQVAKIPLMVTGGFKKHQQAIDAVARPARNAKTQA